MATTKRRYLTKKQKAELCLKQDGRCAVCGERLVPGNIQYDHIHQLGTGGGNEIGNYRALCADPCHKAKSASDSAVRGKIRRSAGRKAARFKPRAHGANIAIDETAVHASVRPKPRWGNRKLQSHPFPKRPK